MRANGKPSPSPKLHIVTGVTGVGTNDEFHGHAGVILASMRDRPFACFGLKRPPKGKTSYLYFLLLKDAPPIQASIEISIQSNVRPPRSMTSAAITLSKRKIKVSLQFDVEEKTLAVSNETVQVGDLELNDGEPRVFLVDMAQKKITYVPVQVPLPDDVPELKNQHPSARDEALWAATAARVVEQMKKNSPEITKFFEPQKPKRAASAAAS